MSDLIDRQAVLDAIENNFVGNSYDIAEVIKKLPSADLRTCVSRALSKEETERFRKEMKYARVGLYPNAEPHSINLNQGQSSDLISRQAAIELFRKRGDIVEVGWIKELPSAEPQERKTGQWIPCSERLPEEDGRYLCFVGIGSSRLCMVYGFATDLHTVSRIDFEYSRGAGFYDYDSEYGYGETTEYVKAWQPLPEPYKEEINEHS